MTTTPTKLAAPDDALPTRRAGPRRASARAATATAVLAVVAGVALRWHALGRESLWFDEGYTAWVIGHRPAEIVRLIRADTAPPLYYLVLHLWATLAGTSEWALRAPSAACSSLTLALLWRLARRLMPGDPWPAAGAAALAAAGYLNVAFAAEARAYALMALLCVTALYAVVRRAQGGSWRWVATASLSTAGALYAHNIAALYAAALAAAWAVLPSPRPPARRARDVAAFAAAVTILWLPWAATLRSQAGAVRAGFWVAPPSGKDVVDLFGALAGVRHFYAWDRLLPHLSWRIDVETAPGRIGCAMLVGAALLSALGLRGRPRRAALALTCFALLPPLAGAIVSCWATPILMDKAFLPSAAALPILLALPATSTSRSARRVGQVLLLAALAFSAATLWGYEAEAVKEDWRGAAAYVGGLPPRPRVLVFVANEGQLPFDYYAERGGPGGDSARTEETVTGVPAPFFALDPPRTLRRALVPADLAAAAREVGARPDAEVVLIESHAAWADPERRTLALLRSLRGEPRTRAFHDVTVYRFPQGGSAR